MRIAMVMINQHCRAIYILQSSNLAWNMIRQPCGSYPVPSPITPIKPFDSASGTEQQRSKFLRRIRNPATADLSTMLLAMYDQPRMPINNLLNYPLTDLISLSRPLIWESDGGCCQSGTRVCSGDLALSAPTKCGWLLWIMIGKIGMNLNFYRDVNWRKRVKTTHSYTNTHDTAQRNTYTKTHIYTCRSALIHMLAVAKHQDGAAQHPFRGCIPEYRGPDSPQTWA